MLGPLIFALAMHPFLCEVQRAYPDVQLIAYLDDVCVCGEPSRAQAALKMLQRLCLAKGEMRSNVGKCHCFSPAATPAVARAMRLRGGYSDSAASVAHDGLTTALTSAPDASATAVAAHVLDEAVAAANAEDPSAAQAAAYDAAIAKAADCTRSAILLASLSPTPDLAAAAASAAESACTPACPTSSCLSVLSAASSAAAAAAEGGVLDPRAAAIVFSAAFEAVSPVVDLSDVDSSIKGSPHHLPPPGSDKPPARQLQGLCYVGAFHGDQAWVEQQVVDQVDVNLADVATIGRLDDSDTINTAKQGAHCLLKWCSSSTLTTWLRTTRPATVLAAARKHDAAIADAARTLFRLHHSTAASSLPQRSHYPGNPTRPRCDAPVATSESLYGANLERARAHHWRV